jgi:putative NIF3 family GTP cyclohydrolase 1 type 2
VTAVPLADLAAFLDEYLRVRDVPDERNAVNGLQVENSGAVGSIIAAVDASQTTIAGAAAARRAGRRERVTAPDRASRAFLDGNVPVTGRRYRRMSALIESDIALYSAHIPLDLHPEVGNNVVLAERLGIQVEGWFGDYKGSALGVWGFAAPRWGTRDALVAELDRALGTFAPGARLLGGGPERVSRVGIITGGAGGMIGARA